MSVKRRMFIRVLSFFAAILVVLAAAGLSAQKAKASYEETLGKMRLSALASLCEFSRDISAGLRLLAVSADNSMGDSAAYLSARVAGATGCLNSFDSGNVKNISAFLNGINGYVRDFSGSESERKAAVMLSDYAQELYYHLNDLTSAVMNGKYILTEYPSVYTSEKHPYYEDYLDFSNGNESEIFKLIIPAAVSVHGCEFLRGKEKITEEDAKKIASRVAGVNMALWRTEKNIEHEIELYPFVYGDISADICKSGGAVCRLVKPSLFAQTVYSAEEAEKRAVIFAETNGYADLTAVQMIGGDFEACFYMFPEVNGILLLTARIEVTVCLASGEITYFDAAEYIKNYRNDLFVDMGNPDLKNFLPANLFLEKQVNCLADIDGKERLCYLCICYFEGDTVLIYIDASDFEVLKTEIKYAKMQ